MLDPPLTKPLNKPTKYGFTDILTINMINTIIPFHRRKHCQLTSMSPSSFGVVEKNLEWLGNVVKVIAATRHPILYAAAEQVLDSGGEQS